MNYGAHLARSLAVVETNPGRRDFLLRTDRTRTARPGVQDAFDPLPAVAGMPFLLILVVMASA